MMNVGLHHRSVDPQLRAVLQSELDRRPNHQVVDCFQRLWGQTDEATLEGVMLRHRRAVEVGELTKRQSICDALTQLAIVPVLEPHQNQRAQNLCRRQSVTTAIGLLQATHQIPPHTLDDVPLIVEKAGYRLQQRLQANALIALPHQLPIGKADLSRRRSHTARLFLLLAALARSRFSALTYRGAA
jgi:hypothetical protein